MERSSLFGVSSALAPPCSKKPILVPPPSPESKSISVQLNHNAKHFVPLSQHTTTFIHDNPIPDSRLSNVPFQESSASPSVSVEPVSISDFDDSGVEVDELSEEQFNDLAEIEGIWDHCLQADDEAEPPAPCSCHGTPIGSCPSLLTDLVKQIVLCRSWKCPNMDGAKIPLISPSFPADVWQAALGNYFDANEIVQAIRFGWDMDFVSVPTPKDASRNNASAMQFPEDTTHYVEKETEFGSLVGPFHPKDLPFPIFRSPFGSVPKPKAKWRRTVTDCSQLDKGVNMFINPRFHRNAPWKLTLPNSAAIVQAILRVRKLYPNQRVFMFKVDMSRWYRQIQLDPSCIPFFAVQWLGKVYLDCCLSFGNRGAALAAQRFMWAIMWIYRTQLPPHQGTYNTGRFCSCGSHCDCGENTGLVYIDDSLGFTAEAFAQDSFSSYLALADHLGLKLSTTPGHISPPGPVCIALGLEYNLDDNTISLPKAKVDALTVLLNEYLDRPRATERDLASLAGKLLNAANVLFSGRLFLNRILATKRRASRFAHPIYLEEAFRDDVQWWVEALRIRNGVSFLVHDSSAEITLDASTDGWHGRVPGIGAYHFQLNEFISVSPPEHLHQLHISDLELLAHVLVARVWGPQMAKQQVTVWTDNKACFWLSKNGRSAVDQRLKMARIYATSQVTHDYRAIPAWISTEDNWVADALSRPNSSKCWGRFESFASSLGARPIQRQISPEMFSF